MNVVFKGPRENSCAASSYIFFDHALDGHLLPAVHVDGLKDLFGGRWMGESEMIGML
jgi:hypothetical protein